MSLPSLPPLPLFAYSWFRSHRVWTNEPTSGPHNYFRLKGPRWVVRSLLLPHSIVSPVNGPSNPLPFLTYLKLSRSSNSCFTTGKHTVAI